MNQWEGYRGASPLEGSKTPTWLIKFLDWRYSQSPVKTTFRVWCLYWYLVHLFKKWLPCWTGPTWCLPSTAWRACMMRTGAAVASSSSSSFIWSLFIPVWRTSRKRWSPFWTGGFFLFLGRLFNTVASAARRSNHSARSHPHSARSHPHSARSHQLSARSRPLYAISQLFLEVSRVSTFSICTVLYRSWYTATAIPFIYSFSGNCGPHISSSRKGRPIVEIYNSFTDTWMWKLGLRPRYSFSGNICFKFSACCLCSVPMRTKFLSLPPGMWLKGVFRLH